MDEHTLPFKVLADRVLGILKAFGGAWIEHVDNNTEDKIIGEDGRITFIAHGKEEGEYIKLEVSKKVVDNAYTKVPAFILLKGSELQDGNDG